MRDVLRHAAKLGAARDGLEVLKKAHDFYHKYSHPTKLTIASTILLSGKGVYVGASFDDNKVYATTVRSLNLDLALTYLHLCTCC